MCQNVTEKRKKKEKHHTEKKRTTWSTWLQEIHQVGLGYHPSGVIRGASSQSSGAYVDPHTHDLYVSRVHSRLGPCGTRYIHLHKGAR